ncbi:MAG: PAS domain S-box protein, partial [Desulfotignum sp.]
MAEKPTYEELERRVQELEKIESEHKYSKEALWENESLFKMLYEKAPLGYQSLDENGHFIVVNKTWLDTLGYIKEEVIGKSFADFLHPDWRDHFKENFPRFKSIGEVLGVEFEMVKKNGDLILVSFTGKISRDKTGNFQQTHCIFHDITERKRVEEALREREGKYRLLFNMGVNAMFLVDNDTTQILECNNKASQLFGYSSQELLSMKMTGLSTTPEATRRACQENVSKMERVYQKKDGGLISVDITSEHFYLANRAVHISAIRDITDKKLAEKALQEKTQFLQNIIDTTSELLSVTDMEGNFKFIGPSHSILGYELDSLVGRNVMELVHPDDYQETATAFAEFLANMEDGRKVEYRYRRSDGEYLWFETVGKFILDDAGNPKQILFSTRDVTERKQAEEALIEREALFRGMFNDHSAVMLLIDPNTGQIIKANQAAVQYYGYPLEKMLQMKIQQLNILSPEHVAEQMHSASKKQINIFEFQHMLADGQVRDVEVHSAPITIQHQTLLFSIIRDITERNQAEATLRESEERIRTIGDNLQGAQLYQFRVAPDGGTKFTYVSSKVEELHECKPEDVLKDASLLFKRVHPADVDEWQKRTHKSLKELTTYDHTVRIVRKSGEIRWHRMISKPRKLDDGSVLFDGVELDVTERKQAQEALQESLTRYDELVANVPVGVYVFWIRATGHLEFEYVSDRWCEIHQVKREYVLSDATRVNNLVHPDDQDDFLVRNQESFLKRIPFAWEGRFLIGDSDFRWLRIESTPIVFDNGDIRWFGLTWDITDRKQAEEALRESNKTAHQFFSESSAGAFFMMLDEPVEWNDAVDKEKILDYVFDHQRITKINRAMLDQYLASEKDFLCMTPKQLFAHDLEHGRLLWRKMFDQGFLDIESDERRFDGSQMWIIGSYRCMFDEQGRIIGHFGTQLDITEHKQTVEDLRKDREHMGHILRATRTNMNTLDSEYNLRQVDAVWQKIYGDPQGRKCHEYFMGLDKPCKGCGVPQALATQEIIVTEEFLPKENRHIEVHTIPFQDENGEWLVTEFNINITERKQAEAEKEKLQTQLFQAQKMESVGRLAGGVAHDFNNMLGVILGHTELALLQADEHHELHGDLKEIQKAAKRSADITKQLLAFARKQTISPRQLDLNDTVESMLNMLRRLIGEDIDLVWKFLLARAGVHNPGSLHVSGAGGW